MESLLPIVNELQLIFKNFRVKGIELPQIVVVGSQSCGKSSVLESLVRKSFLPRGSGIVTRCPIILQLNQIQDDDSEDILEYFELVPTQASSDVRKFTDASELQLEIESLTNEMAGTNKGIVDDAIVVRVYSPNVVSLTVVDLPGIVKVPVGDQPEDIEEQVMNMIKRYISNENALILAVCPANADIATSESIKLAREVDPDGERTIAVLTKLDLLEKGVTALKELQGEIIPVKLGLVGVINRSQSDLKKNKSITEAFKDEMEKLNSWYPSLVGRIGSEFLAQRLNELLLEHIKKCIPSLKTRLNDVLMEKLKRRELLGRELPRSEAEKMGLMIELMLEFQHTYKTLVEKRPDLDKNLESVGPRIAAATASFAEKLNEIDPLCECDSTWIVQLMKRSTSHEGIISIEDVFKSIVKKQIHNYKEPCKDYVDEFYSILESTVDPSLEHCVRFTKLKRTISSEIKRILEELLKILKDKILEEWFSERLIMIYSTDKDFNELLANGKKQQEEEEEEGNRSRKTNEYNVAIPTLGNRSQKINQHGAAFPPLNELGGTKAEHVQYIRDLVEAFLLSTSNQLINAWPGKVMYKLYAQTMKTFSTEVRKMIVPMFNDLMVEPCQITMDRSRNEEEIDSLEKACIVLNKIQTQSLNF